MVDDEWYIEDGECEQLKILKSMKEIIFEVREDEMDEGYPAFSQKAERIGQEKSDEVVDTMRNGWLTTGRKTKETNFLRQLLGRAAHQLARGRFIPATRKQRPFTIGEGLARTLQQTHSL